MFLFRGLLSVFISLLLAVSCWGSAESPEQKAARYVRDNLSSLYFCYVFAEENESLLKAIMVSVRQVYDSYEQDQGAEEDFLPGSQTETRQQFLIRLVQQAVRHTTSKVISNKVDDSHPDRPMFHLLQAFSNAPGMEESPDITRWYRTRPVLLHGVSAEDRTDSMDSLIEEAVQNSFKVFSSNGPSQEDLSWQLGIILVEMQELFLRGKALRHLSYRVDEEKQNPEIARDPAFVLYVSSLTERFNKHPTLWHTDSERRQYQKDLSALFMEAAGREDYDTWYQQVRRVLEVKKPVTYHSRVQDAANGGSQSKKPFTYPPRRDDYWLNLFNDWYYKQLLLIGALLGGFPICAMAIAIFDGQLRSQREQWAWEGKQAGELQKKLGKALDKPERKDRKGRGWEPDSRDREEVKKIMEGFDRKITEKVLISARILDPNACHMDMTDLYMQIPLTKLYAYLKEHGCISTKEVKRRQKRETRHSPTSSSSSQQREKGVTSWGTPTTSKVKRRKAT
ncbi:hypothetical protein [Endozoicomonas sp. 4G]|uniref:hypothetical protein n=1 Tax=Endozoicomonas sp. 4G TaxID=2872754 RepID=UPI0020786205|nr:hypothetical protein [Endozoicomonas sp. 4G]